MLKSLTIRQIALIDEAQITFHHGLQVLTGETGAGKSIVVDSVNLILGGRADREMIRSGAERASVEAVFDIDKNEAAKTFLENESIEFDDSLIIIYREITTAGKNTCRICGVLVPLSKLRELSGMLMDLHGQSEHQFLANPEKHLSYLDQTGDRTHRLLLEKTKESCDRFLNNHREYAKLIRKSENKDEKIESLERDLILLKKAHIHPGEAQSLAEKRKEIETAVKKNETFKQIRQALSGDDGEKACLQNLKDITILLKSIKEEKQSAISQLSDKCESLYYELEEVAYQINLLSYHYNSDSDDLEKTDKRLELIHRLEYKFKTDADKLPALECKIAEDLSLLRDLGTQTEAMASEHKKLLAEYRKNARDLTESRLKLAIEFENKMMKELSDLGMGSTLFKVLFKTNENGKPLMPTPEGDDRIEFMIAPNPGEPLKPLSKIASGGELSRIMLALKAIESARTGVDSMVFDEIDTGISGRMAQIVAEKMITISRSKQVICVTHLPQIAASADYHFLVSKHVSQQRTNTSITELNQKGRIEEVSRMISGADGITSESIEYGARLLNAASSMKSQK